MYVFLYRLQSLDHFCFINCFLKLKYLIDCPSHFIGSSLISFIFFTFPINLLLYVFENSLLIFCQRLFQPVFKLMRKELTSSNEAHDVFYEFPSTDDFYPITGSAEGCAWIYLIVLVSNYNHHFAYRWHIPERLKYLRSYLYSLLVCFQSCWMSNQGKEVQ